SPPCFCWPRASPPSRPGSTSGSGSGGAAPSTPSPSGRWPASGPGMRKCKPLPTQQEGEPIMTTATTKMPVHTPGRVRTAALWTLSALLALAFVGSGLMKFLSAEMAGHFAGWGYPSGFHLLIGGLEIIGGLLLLVPTAAPWATWVLATVMVGAALTHLRAGE